MSQIKKYRLDQETIEKKLNIINNKIILNTLKKVNVLPFDPKGNFKSDIKHFDVIAKSIFQKILNVDPIELGDQNNLILDVLNNIDTQHRSELNSIVQELYFDQGKLKSFHPKIMMYQGKTKKSIDNTASFFVKTFVNDEIKENINRLTKAEASHLLDKVILEVLPDYTTKEHCEKLQAYSLLPMIQKCFINDFNYISSNEELFMDSALKLIKYYMFFYTSQIIICLKNGFKTNAKVCPVYYFVGWEKISKTRSGYIQGWKMVKSKSEDIFAYTNLLQILNQTESSSIIGNFEDVKRILDTLSVDEIHDFNHTIEDLIKKMRFIHDMSELKINNREPLFGEYEVIDRLLITLLDCRDEGTANRGSAFDKFETSILEMAKPDFIKARGRLGSTLNLSQEWIIFFTKLAIGNNEKILLNTLWSELEKRGLFFDKFTKEEIVDYFEKINVLEKKSDSGDAQYVRIL